eukprot:1315459-Rhodomonas_salina.1
MSQHANSNTPSRNAQAGSSEKSNLFAIRANAVGVDEDIDHAVCHAQIAQPAFQVIPARAKDPPSKHFHTRNERTCARLVAPVEGYDQLLHLLQLRLHLGKVEVRVPLADPVEHLHHFPTIDTPDHK